MARSQVVIARLQEQQLQNPDLPHYEIDFTSTLWPPKPDDVKTAGYWKLDGRRVPKGTVPTAFVVSGHGGKLNGTILPTRWVPAYHFSQTVPIKPRAQVKPHA